MLSIALLSLTASFLALLVQPHRISYARVNFTVYQRLEYPFHVDQQWLGLVISKSQVRFGRRLSVVSGGTTASINVL